MGGLVRKSEDPLNNEQLASANTVIKLGANTKLIAEVARSENTIDPANSLSNINASVSTHTPVLYRTSSTMNNTIMHHNQADSGFYNTASPITSGRKESGIKSAITD